MKKLSLSFLLCCMQTLIFAQDKTIDSLENLLNNHSAKDTIRINLLNDIAYLLISIDVDKTLKYATEADSISNFLDYKKGKAKSLRLTAIFYDIRSDYPKALEYFKKALHQYEEIGERKEIAKCYHNIGFIYKKLCDYPQALEFYHKTLTLYDDLNDRKGISKVYNSIGIIYDMQGDYPNALEYYQKAFKINEELNHKLGISSAFNNIGIIYLNQGDLLKALDYYQKSLKIDEMLNDKSRIADSYINIGGIYGTRGNYHEAMEYYQKSLIIYKELGSKSGISLSYHDIGNILNSQGNCHDALEYYQKALKIAKEIGSQTFIAEINVGFCQVYFKLEKYDLAITYGELAYKTAVSIGERKQIKNASEILSKAYAALGNFKKAYTFYLEYKTQSDSINNEKNIKKIVGLEYSYKYEKEKELAKIEKQKEEAVYNAEIKRQSIVRNSLIAAFTLMLLLAFFIFRSYRIKTKANRLLAEQKEEIKSQAEELKTTNEKLVELDQFKEGMTGMIVHDLKNPLNTILSLSKEPETRFAGKQMLNMVLNILDVQKFESAQMKIQTVDFSLYHCLIDTLQEVKTLYERKSIRIENSLSNELIVKGDEELIHRVFINLLTNAIKYTSNNGQLTIDNEKLIKNNEEYAKIKVRDTGQGIPADKLNTVFEKFAQVQAKSSGGVRSTGLGLTFCKLAIESHGGQIGVESEIGVGSTFWFSLPIGECHNVKIQQNEVIQPIEELDLSENDKKYLFEFVKKLKELKVFEFSDIDEILQSIVIKNRNIEIWKTKVENALRACNEEKFHELLNI